MQDLQKLIDIARQIDPDLKDPEQALIDAVAVVKALAILESQEAKPISIIHNVLSKKYGKLPNERPVKVPMPDDLREEIAAEKALRVPKFAKSLSDAAEQKEDRKAIARTIKKFVSRKGVRVSAFAREMNVSVSTIHSWIGGKWSPQPKYMPKLLQILNGEIELKPIYADQAQIEEGN